MPEHRSIAGLLRKSSGRLAPPHKTFRRTILPIGWANHSIHVKSSVAKEAHTRDIFHCFTIPIYSIAVTAFLAEKEFATCLARCALVSCHRRHLASSGSEILSQRSLCNKVGVPNADITLPPRLHGEPLRPGKGRVRRQKRRTAHLVHARLSSSIERLVLCAFDVWRAYAYFG